jgi:hypothetical protein
VVVFRSTLVPGTVEDTLRPIIEASSGKRDGEGFHLCFQPEFLREGSSIRDYDKPPFTVVGADHDYPIERLRELFGHLPCKFIRTSVRSAEMMKYCCNNFHALKITFANETARLCAALGVDAFEVMDLVCQDTQLNISRCLSAPRLRLRRFVPAQGSAGHHVSGQDPRCRTAHDVRHHGSPIAHTSILPSPRSCQSGCRRIGMLGLSFKTGTDDLRESPLVTLAEQLIGKGLQLSIYDPDVHLSRLLGANKRFIENPPAAPRRTARSGPRRRSSKAPRCSSSACPRRASTTRSSTHAREDQRSSGSRRCAASLCDAGVGRRALLVKSASRTPTRLLGWCALVSAAFTILLTLSISPHLTSSTELVRLRNALLLDGAAPEQGNWTPAAVPASFRVEQAEPNALFRQVVDIHHLRHPNDDWLTALSIGRHLLHWEGRRSGGPIQSDLDDTYRRITIEGEGYCGDFADVFTGLANTAGLFSRAWAFSFDGFGGHGHILNEIWDRQRQRWVMIDVYHNYYVTGPDGEPLSAAAFRNTMLGGGEGLSLVLIEPAARPGYIHEARAWDYYRRGLPEWYLWMGNNVFEYDRNPFVRAVGQAHRSVEQLGGIVAGVHPKIGVVKTEDNAAALDAMRALRARLMLIVVVGVFSLLAWLGWLALSRRNGTVNQANA